MTEDSPLILVVDDYQDAREMYAEYLQFSGFRVAEARNGNEAVAQAFSLRPDLSVGPIRGVRICDATAWYGKACCVTIAARICRRIFEP